MSVTYISFCLCELKKFWWLLSLFVVGVFSKDSNNVIFITFSLSYCEKCSILVLIM
jgi:hypothetical protein